MGQVPQEKRAMADVAAECGGLHWNRLQRPMEKKMTSHPALPVRCALPLRSTTSIGAAVAGLGLSSLSSPVFAGDLGLSLPPQNSMLLGIVVLLAIALGVRLMRRNVASDDTRSGNMPVASDMRWWRNSHA